ncbi:MAG: LacI family DNA-binding transcriptional regulator [Tissierellia bacterium]|nr:LacI family DNA-binding transcriptional regulator [Tissierellia bacterium]
MASTIKDVAKMADVSISTVSRVINDSKPVSPEARRRVLHAIEVLDYKPNEVARSLVTKKSNLIGVIVSDIGNAYVSQVLRGVEEIGRMYNYDILLSSSYADPEIELKFAKLFSQKQVEGIIVISEILNSKLMYKLDEFKIPYLVINRFYNIEEAATVSINNKDAAYKMTKYLIDQGHKKIGYVALRKDMDRTNETYKIKGYRQAMGEEDLEPHIIYAEGLEGEAASEIIPEILDDIDTKGITALFCTQDILALSLINEFYDRGIKVPEDISVCGFGGSKLSGMFRPRLTTVKEPFYDIGAVAIRKLLKTIENKEKVVDKETVLLPVQILKRDSVNPLE